MIDLSIIIVNFKTEQFVLNCIESIKQNTDGDIKYEINVIDNSKDNYSFEESLKSIPEVSYYGLNTNFGFGYACNRGAEKAHGEVLLFLNPDIIATKDSINNLYNLLIGKQDTGFVTGLLTDESGKLQYFYNYFPGLIWEFKEAFGLYVDKTINKLNSINEIKDKKPFQIDWAHGACLMIKAEVFKKTSGFDEKLFLYYEDVDLQKQVSNLKYKNYCQPDSRFIHFERGSVRSLEGLKIYHFYLHYSKLYYMKKYFPTWKRFAVRIFYITGFITKIIMLPFRKKFIDEKSKMLSVYILVISVYINLKTSI